MSDEFLEQLTSEVNKAIENPGEPCARETFATTFICGECYRAGRGHFELVYEPNDDGSSVHHCPTCGHVAVVHLEMGKLDLGFIRPSPNDDNDFELFHDSFGVTPPE